MKLLSSRQDLEDNHGDLILYSMALNVQTETTNRTCKIIEICECTGLL